MFRLLVLGIALGACSGVTPPPNLLGHGGPRHGGAWGSDVAIGAGMGVGVPGALAIGGGPRYHLGLSDELSIGVQYDRALFETWPQWEHEASRQHADTGRAIVRWYPRTGAGAIRLEGGVGGGGATTGLRYGTLDSSLVIGTETGAARVYGGPQLALAIPIRPGADSSTTTAYFGLVGGLELVMGGGVSLFYELGLHAGRASAMPILLGGGGSGGIRLLLPES